MRKVLKAAVSLVASVALTAWSTVIVTFFVLINPSLEPMSVMLVLGTALAWLVALGLAATRWLAPLWFGVGLPLGLGVGVMGVMSLAAMIGAAVGKML